MAPIPNFPSLASNLLPWPTVDPKNVSRTPPKRQIKTEEDMVTFKNSEAYNIILSYIYRLRSAVSSKSLDEKTDNVPVSGTISGRLVLMLSEIENLIAANPPVDTLQRFGNISFRSFHRDLKENISSFLLPVIGQDLIQIEDQLIPFLLDSFGNGVRIDYGSGHELSFICFLASLHCLGLTVEDDLRLIVDCVFRQYWILIGKLQDVYKLEPAGSHGVWGLDDYSFLPYYFGSAELQGNTQITPDMTLKPENLIHTREFDNLYVMAITRIMSQKSGPFHEHSPQLHSIATSVTGGWNKINQGLANMYIAEVLGKRVVVQHLWFSDLLNWKPCVNQNSGQIKHKLPVAENSKIKSVHPLLHTESQSLCNIDVRDLKFTTPKQCMQKQDDTVKFSDTIAYRYISIYLNHAAKSVKGSSSRDQLQSPPQHTGPYLLLQALSRVSELAEENSPQKAKVWPKPGFLNFHQGILDNVKDILKPLIHNHDVQDQFVPLFTSSFGNSNHHVYGSVHELSFIAFLTCLRLVGALKDEDAETVVTQIFTRYYQLIGKIQDMYHMGLAVYPNVWKIDSWSHLSYYFGTSQLQAPYDLLPPNSLSWKDTQSELDDNLYVLSMRRLYCYDVDASARLCTFVDANKDNGWLSINEAFARLYITEVLDNAEALQDLYFNDLLPWIKFTGDDLLTPVKESTNGVISTSQTRSPWTFTPMENFKNVEHILPPPMKIRNGRHTLASTGSASAMTSPFGSLHLPTFNTHPTQKLRDVHADTQ